MSAPGRAEAVQRRAEAERAVLDALRRFSWQTADILTQYVGLKLWRVRAALKVLRTAGRVRRRTHWHDGNSYTWLCDSYALAGDEYMSKDDWHRGPPPVREDGRCILIILKDRFQTSNCKPYEYYGKPIVVCCWDTLRTTINALHFRYNDVKCWREIGNAVEGGEAS